MSSGNADLEGLRKLAEDLAERIAAEYIQGQQLQHRRAVAQGRFLNELLRLQPTPEEIAEILYGSGLEIGQVR